MNRTSNHLRKKLSTGNFSERSTKAKKKTMNQKVSIVHKPRC